MSRTKAKTFKLVIITGLSGSGKSTALKLFEDSGFYCVDNLPAMLLNRFIELCKHSTEEFSRVALCLDTRERKFFNIIPEELTKMKQADQNLTIIFLDCDDEVIKRRYSETRRRHPIHFASSISEGIKKERKILSPLRAMADIIIDTTNLNTVQLRKEISNYIEKVPDASNLNLNLISFGYRYGIPTESDIVMDVRFLPNPFFNDKLRSLTGLNKSVHKYIMKFRETKLFLEKWKNFLDTFLPYYLNEGKKYITISIGCTGGVHRSVAIVEIIKRHFQNRKGIKLNVKHRDIDK
jgi:UPF0042 nucleotide-binding protein